MSRGPIQRLAALLLPSLLLVAACGATEGGTAIGPTVGTPTGTTSPTVTVSTVDATLKDFSIGLDPSTVDAGEITFRIRNDGPSEHEFVIVATGPGVAPEDLPTQDGGVNEEGLDIIDEVEAIGVGDEEELTADLEPGDYVVICNIDGHYVAGMHAALTVR